MNQNEAAVTLLHLMADCQLPPVLVDRLRELRDAWGRDELTSEDAAFFEGLAAEEIRLARFRADSRRLLDTHEGKSESPSESERVALLK